MLLGVVLVGRALEERAKLQASADMAALQVGSQSGWPARGMHRGLAPRPWAAEGGFMLLRVRELLGFILQGG
jgi:hypothetical protein